jgi:hypothetical protein
MNKEGFFFQVKGKRRLSVFFVKENMLDFVKDRIDLETSREIQKMIEQEPGLRREHELVAKGIENAKLIAQATVPIEILQQVDYPETYLSILMVQMNYERWPLALRWAVESALVSIAAIACAILIPWQKVFHAIAPQGQSKYILAEVDVSQKEKIEADIAPAPPLAELLEQKPIVEVPTIKEQTQDHIARKASPSKSEEGALYRGTLKINSLDASDEMIREKIYTLGGKKAGEVELGWRKSAKLSYYHFTIPEENFLELEANLKKYGKYELNKEKHSRLMPQGQRRVILSVVEVKQ